MQKLSTAILIFLLSTFAYRAAAQTRGFQQLSFTAGTGRFGRISPSIPVQPGYAYSGRFKCGFYAVPHLFIDFGVAASNFQASYRYTNYSSPTGEVTIRTQQLFMLSQMAGAGVCLSNHKLHLLLGAHATLNLMFPGKNPFYYTGYYRSVGAGVSPHADISFPVGKRLLLGISGQAMFFSGIDKKEHGLTGSYIGGGIHLQHSY